jgi:hypothetical protein
MPEPLADRLKRFTPESGLDRDALLFALGRASDRPARVWMLLAGALAACQVLTLVLLWPRPSPPGPAGPPVAPLLPRAAPSPTTASEQAALQRWDVLPGAVEPPPVGPLVPDAPALGPFAPPDWLQE